MSHISPAYPANCPRHSGRHSHELRGVSATYQAIRQEVRPNRAATEIPAALTPVAGKPVSGWSGGSDGR
jgi:hypothetical protein